MEESSNSNTLLEVVDDFYTALQNEGLIPISDEKFAVELQLQEVIFSSILFILSTTPSLETAIIPSSENNDTTPTESNTLVITETGESSRSFCDICMEVKRPHEMFMNKNCSHVFCNDCISNHVAVKIQESIAMVICPGLECKGVLEPDLCRPIIPTQVFERWEAALSESMVLGSQKFYCPFKDCSTLLIDDGGDVVRQSECPNCRRLFCAQCKVAWHPGIGCEEYKGLNKDEKGKDDLMVMELVKSKEWKRCSRCKFYVEKTEGCMHMTCRVFVYNKHRTTAKIKWPICTYGPPHDVYDPAAEMKYNTEIFISSYHGGVDDQPQPTDTSMVLFGYCLIFRCGFQFCYRCGLTWSLIHSCSCNTT